VGGRAEGENLATARAYAGGGGAFRNGRPSTCWAAGSSPTSTPWWPSGPNGL
jgi:hypothetical protein